LAYGISDRFIGATRDFAPDDKTRFAVRLQVFVGETQDGAPDSFDVTVCSPTWLVDNFGHFTGNSPANSDVVVGHGVWLQEFWNADEIQKTLETLVRSAVAPDWPDLANWLGRYVPWEYSYKYDRDHGVVVDIETVYPQFRRNNAGD